MHLSKRAHDYKHAIQTHSLQSTQDTIYPGQQYTFLAKHLQQDDLANPVPNGTHDLGILCMLGTNASRARLKFKYQDLEDLLKVPEPDELRGQILFLRGHLPSSWINSIGSKYIIDPDFFRQHLDLPSIPKVQSLFATPCLPSVQKMCLTLRINTIFCTDPVCTDDSRSTYIKRKGNDRVALEDYLGGFLMNAKPGDSLVRAFSRVERKFSVIEQNLSICVENCGKGWIGELI